MYANNNINNNIIMCVLGVQYHLTKQICHVNSKGQSVINRF